MQLDGALKLLQRHPTVLVVVQQRKDLPDNVFVLPYSIFITQGMFSQDEDYTVVRGDIVVWVWEARNAPGRIVFNPSRPT